MTAFVAGLFVVLCGIQFKAGGFLHRTKSEAIRASDLPPAPRHFRTPEISPGNSDIALLPTYKFYKFHKFHVKARQVL